MKKTLALFVLLLAMHAITYGQQTFVRLSNSNPDLHTVAIRANANFTSGKSITVDIDNTKTNFIDNSLKASINQDFTTALTSPWTNVYQRTKAIRQSVRKKISDSKSAAVSKQQARDAIKTILDDKRSLMASLYETWITKKNCRFLPVRNEVFARSFYGSNPDRIIDPLKNNYLTANDRAIGIYSEFFAGFLGPVRWSLGGYFSRSKLPNIDTSTFTSLVDSLGIPQYNNTDIQSLIDSVDELNNRAASFQNFLAGGGNTMIITSLPFFDMNDNAESIKFTGYLTNKLALNIPGMSNGIKNVSFLDDLSAELFFNYTPTTSTTDPKYSNAISLYAYVKNSVIFGTKNFMEDIGLNASTKAIYLCQVNVGISILENLRLFYKYSITSDKDANKNVPKLTFGFNITPTKI